MTTQFPVVSSKNRMYDLLSRGCFGNTIPMCFSVNEWLSKCSDRHTCKLWAVRSLVPGGPCRLNCPVDEVVDTCLDIRFLQSGVCISAMADSIAKVTLWADVFDSPTGLIVYGIEGPPAGGSWRDLMPRFGREHRGVEAHTILKRHLNANSLSDLEALRDLWPHHVYELSALNRCFGTVPNRNAIIWEVRTY